MIDKSDLEIIRIAFKYSMMRMEELPVEATWGTQEIRYKRIQEEKKKQANVLEKLQKLL